MKTKNYPIVIKLFDGKTETILEAHDFEELVEKYMGKDSADYFYSIIEDLNYEIEDLKDEIADLKEELKDANY